LLDRLAGLSESLLDPGERQGQSRALPLQPARKFRYKRAHHRQIRARHVGNQQNQALRVLLGNLRHLIRAVVRMVAVHPVGSDPDPHPSEVLDQGQTQHDRDCPQLTQLQGRDGLVGANEAAEALRIHPPISV
jgi:hypothetical protein